MGSPRKSVSPSKKNSPRKQNHDHPMSKKDQLGLVMDQLKTALTPHLEGSLTQDKVNCGDSSCPGLHSLQLSRANNWTFGDVYRLPHRDCPNKRRDRVSPCKLDSLRFQAPFNNLLKIREMLETADNPRTPDRNTATNTTSSQTSSDTAALSSPSPCSPATFTVADSSPLPVKQEDELRDFFNPGPVPMDTPIRDLTRKVVRTPFQHRPSAAIPIVTPSSPTKRARDDDSTESLSPIKRVRKDDDDDKLWEEVEQEFPFDIPLLSNKERAAFAIDKKTTDLDFPIDVYLFASDGQPRIERVYRRASKQLALEDVHILAPYHIIQEVDQSGKIYLGRDSLTPTDFISVLRPFVIFKLPQVAPVVVALWWAQNKEAIKKQYDTEYERYME